MIQQEREKLQNRGSAYLSIGITSNGVPRVSVGIPWEQTAHAFNMRLPQVYLAPEDLQDEEIMHLLAAYKVIGCYIWVPLADYSFLARFKDLQDISIRNGDEVQNLDFLSSLCECRMLYLQNARLKNLDPIIAMKKNCRSIFACFNCIALDNCEVEDISALGTENVHFGEFLIWKPKGSGEGERWNTVCAATYRYYEYKV